MFLINPVHGRLGDDAAFSRCQEINSGRLIDFGKMNELAQLVRELSGVQVPSCRPFVGDGAFTIESGIVTGWYRNVFEDNPTTLYPVHPGFVGREDPKILMGKKSGIDNIWVWGEKLGIELSEDEALAVLKEVKLKSHDLKRVLTESEFMEIAEKVRGKGSGA
ncbi:MAG: hypothetical protein JRK53_13240 [Deltaproteobacteria bacterium]|nr:hypothetical protein [Deltaproteobacteria bacterium]MBW1815910.1 hypothetical protein [Deltaproteobacteria bacterium]MBW2283825.1 hypothetical protein [Deltaproteobacteria bacterium]